MTVGIRKEEGCTLFFLFFFFTGGEGVVLGTRLLGKGGGRLSCRLFVSHAETVRSTLAKWHDPHLVLPGHRSIVNQTRYSKVHHVLATSGVEKVVKVMRQRGGGVAKCKGHWRVRTIPTESRNLWIVHTLFR